MGTSLINFDEEKSRLTEKSSDLYSAGIINIEEYERLIEYINKIETKKEIAIIDGFVQGYNSNNVNHAPVREDASDNRGVPAKNKNANKEHTAVFSWKTTTLEPLNGRGGKFVSIFGANRIIVDNLPPGKTVIKTETVFGLIEIIVSRNIRVTNKAEAVFAGVFGADEANCGAPDLPELVIKGDVVFGSLAVTRK
jgi:hypothetical protein